MKFLHALRSELSVLGLDFLTPSLIYYIYMIKEPEKRPEATGAEVAGVARTHLWEQGSNPTFRHCLALVSSHTRRWPCLLLPPLDRSLWGLPEACRWRLTALRAPVNNGLGEAFGRSRRYRKTGGKRVSLGRDH